MAPPWTPAWRVAAAKRLAATQLYDGSPAVQRHCEKADEQHCKYHTVTHAGFSFLYRQNANDTGALVCLSPKAGSSMWLQALHRGARPGWHDRPMPRRHAMPLPWPSTVEMYHAARASAATPRYAIVRHPHARLLSAWLGKVKNHPQVGTWPVGFAASQPNRSFEALVSYVWRYPYTIVNPHFAQQSALCAGTLPGAAPWRVLRIEEVETWYEELICSLGIAHAVRTGWTKFDPASRIPCMVELACGCSLECARRCQQRGPARHGTFNNADNLMNKYYTPRLVRLVATLVQPDLDAFRYAAWTMGAPLATTLRPLS